MKPMMFAGDVIHLPDEFCCLELEGERMTHNRQGMVQSHVNNRFPDVFTVFIRDRKGHSFTIGYFDSLNRALSYARQVRRDFDRDWDILDGYSWFHRYSRRKH